MIRDSVLVLRILTADLNVKKVRIIRLYMKVKHKFLLLYHAL